MAYCGPRHTSIWSKESLEALYMHGRYTVFCCSCTVGHTYLDSSPSATAFCFILRTSLGGGGDVTSMRPTHGLKNR
jgi:hypothetical protein